MPLYFVVWIHLVAAMTFIGGMMYLQLVLTPVLSSHCSEAEAHEVQRKAGQRFRTVAWMSLVTLILTGAYNMLSEGGSARIETEWGVVLMLKLFLFAIAFGLVLIHDFVLDPYASSSQTTSITQFSKSNVRRAAMVQKMTLVLTLLILFVATYLSTM